MATFSATNNGNGTIHCTSSGVASGGGSNADYLHVVNNTTGAVLYQGAYSSSLSITDSSCAIGSNSYTATYKISATNTTVGTLGASAAPTFPSGSVSVSTTGPFSGCSWSIPDDANVTTVVAGVTLYYTINGGPTQQYGTFEGYGLSGSIPSNSVFVGYSSSITWQANAVWRRDGSSAGSASTGSGSTGPAPPTAPNPPTNLGATDHGTSVDLSWTASVGGASGYEISRGGTVIATQSVTTKTDSSPGSTRPITYSVRAYNSNASGTAYSAPISVLVGSSDSVGVLMG